MIGAIFFDQHAYRFTRIDRVYRVQLHRARDLVVIVVNDSHGLWVAFYKGTGRHHLGDIKPSPYSRHKRRKAVFVMPAMGASTTGASISKLPIWSGGSSMACFDGTGWASSGSAGAR